MAEQQKKDTSPTSLRQKFLQGEYGQDRIMQYQDPALSLNAIHEYTNTELTTLANRHSVRAENPTSRREVQQQDLLNAVMPSHQNLVSSVTDAERLQALDPNIKAAENIVVASIMSPNDLQDADPTIVIDSASLSQDTKESISKLLTDYYCDEYKLGKRMVKWVREALFRSGAGVTLLLPEATLTSLINTYDPDLGKELGASKENLSTKVVDCLLSDTFLDNIRNTNIYSNDKTSVYGRESAILSQQYLAQKKQTSDKIGIPVSKSTDVRRGTGDLSITDLTEEFQGIAKEAYRELLEEQPRITSFFETNDGLDKHLRQGVEKLTVKFANDLNSGDTIKLSENPEIVRAGKIIKDAQQTKFSRKLQAIINNVNDDTDPDKKDAHSFKYQYQEVIDLIPHLTAYTEQKAAPFAIDVHTESVIPICVPGSTEHLGYLILLDAFGQPIEASTYILNNNGCTVSSRISSAYVAMYGDVPTSSGIQSPSYGFNSNFMQNVTDFRKTSLNKVFNYVLDEMLKKKLQDIGLNDVTVGKYDNIATCMLYRLFEKKKTTLLFVPAQCLSYVAFDYRRDGTGKSKIDDLLFTESLKMTFLVGNTMAIMKNATPVKKVSLNLDKKQTNPLQTISALRNAIVEKEKLPITTYPAVISQQMILQNLSIDAKSPDSEFAMTIEDTHREIPRADTDFFQELDNRSMITLDVPPSALSEAREVQFARSIATTNLFFAKKIRSYQTILEEFTAEHVKMHARMHTTLVAKIASFLNKNAETNTDPTKVQPATGDTRIGVISRKLTPVEYRKALDVIDSITIELPKPTVAPDKTQYENFAEAMKAVEDYVNTLINDDIVPSDYSELADTLKNVKGMIRQDLMRQVGKQLGFSGILAEVPTLEEYILKDKQGIGSHLGMLANLKNSIKMEHDKRTKVSPENTEGEATGGSDFGF